MQNFIALYFNMTIPRQNLVLFGAQQNKNMAAFIKTLHGSDSRVMHLYLSIYSFDDATDAVSCHI